jgi:protein-tyrosine-phosphatase
MRTSSADGRDRYYRIDLDRCGELLAATGGSLHPGLRLTPPQGITLPARTQPVRVLFLCTGNSARSQMAEAMIKHMSEQPVQAFSAGSHPKTLHPMAVQSMRERGLDISRQRTKHLSEFEDQQFDYIVTLCDRVKEVCPEFPSYPSLIHWSIADPAAEGRAAAFERTAADLESRIRFLLYLIAQE